MQNEVLYVSRRVIVVTLIGILSAAASAQTPLSCVSEMVMPRFYRLLAGRDPIRGTAHITIDERGRAGTVRYEADVKVMNVELEELFREQARYSPSCAGKTVTFVVEYVPLDKPAEANPVPTIRFRAPNRFIVEFAPPSTIAHPVRKIDIRKR
jgi:hypothetical protein